MAISPSYRLFPRASISPSNLRLPFSISRANTETPKKKKTKNWEKPVCCSSLDDDVPRHFTFPRLQSDYTCKTKKKQAEIKGRDPPEKKKTNKHKRILPSCIFNFDTKKRHSIKSKLDVGRRKIFGPAKLANALALDYLWGRTTCCKELC